VGKNANGLVLWLKNSCNEKSFRTQGGTAYGTAKATKALTQSLKEGGQQNWKKGLGVC